MSLSKSAMTTTILEAKENRGTTWAAIAEATGLHEVYVTSACYGMNHLESDQADKLAGFLGLGPEVSQALQAFPHKAWDNTIPTDPVIYRFYEAINVYGDTMKALIHEKFGDGIMSAIDFTMDIDKVEDPKGDRVKITWNGKFLPYKSW
ncbi:cyanase [Thioalkalivibrio sp. ALE16]|uniref:cyanase n=1 Tax=Thioalkalivibrio sp. ALE16 TaxID=1158172 RepID=UPI00037F39B9|nr:cyanase [Thioalkalivibrio sp. ALE16]